MAVRKAIDIIDEMPDIPHELRQIYEFYAKKFDEGMPDVLYKNYYELADHIPDTIPDRWEEFLDIPEVHRYKQAKIAKLTELDALKALRTLSEKSTQENAAAVAALREILEKSKLIQDSNKRQQQIVLTHIPPRKD